MPTLTHPQIMLWLRGIKMIHVLGNVYRGPYCTYGMLHQQVMHWIAEGEFKFSGKRSEIEVTDLDKFILDVFSFNKMYPNNTIEERVEKLNTQLKNGTIRLPWLHSEHGATLWKAMVERHG